VLNSLVRYAGNQATAREAAAEIDKLFTEARLRSHPMLATFFEAYAAVPLMVLVRFGCWEEVLAMPLPTDPSLYVTKTLFSHFARGLAHGVLAGRRTGLASIKGKADPKSPAIQGRAEPAMPSCCSTLAHTLAEAKVEQQRFLACNAAIRFGDRKHHNVDLTQMAAIAERVLEGQLIASDYL
jgi:hypothetical protein